MGTRGRDSLTDRRACAKASPPERAHAILAYMSGFVFHPGHDEWHGQTVVVYTKGARVVAGRWDAVQGGELLMRDAAVHDDPASRASWVAAAKQYGIPVQHRTLTLPHAEVERVVRLRDA